MRRMDLGDIEKIMNFWLQVSEFQLQITKFNVILCLLRKEYTWLK